MIYNEKYLLKVLQRHGWKPVIFNKRLPKEYALMALQILVLENLAK